VQLRGELGLEPPANQTERSDTQAQAA